MKHTIQFEKNTQFCRNLEKPCNFWCNLSTQVWAHQCCIDICNRQASLPHRFTIRNAFINNAIFNNKLTLYDFFRNWRLCWLVKTMVNWEAIAHNILFSSCHATHEKAKIVVLEIIICKPWCVIGDIHNVSNVPWCY